MTDLVHPLTLNAALGIDFLPSANGPATDHPDAPNASKAYVPSTGDWYTKKTSGWIQDGSATGGSADWASITSKPTTRDGYGITDVYTKTAGDARYLLLTGGTVTGNLVMLGVLTTGQSGAGTGGQIHYVDDGGTYRWASGIPGSSGSRDWFIYDIVNSRAALTLDHTTSALTIAGDFVGTRVGIHDNLICEVYTNSTGNLAFNYYGYNFGITQFRDFSIFDGKSANILYITGSTKAAVFAGAVTINGAGKFASTVTLGSWLGLTIAGGSPTGYLTAAQSANSTINGSAAGDVCIRGDGKRILFSTDSGTTAETALTGGGRLYTLGSVNSEAQGRFKGWYNISNDSVGPAAEIGYSSGTAYVIGYNRSTSAYLPMSIQGSSLIIACATSVTGTLSVSGAITGASASFGGYPPAIVRTGAYTSVPGDLASGQIFVGY